MRKLRYNRIRAWAAVLLLLAVGLALPARAAEADSGVCGESLKWALSDGALTITGSGAMTDFADNQFAPWYGRAEEIRALSLPEGLTRVGDLAFYGCTALTRAALPDSVTTVGEYAFAGCTDLRTVRFSAGLTSIEANAFRECGALAAIRLPSTLERIGAQAFYRCGGLSVVTVPASVTRMGSSVFAYCTGLVRAEIYARLTELPEWTFYGCDRLSDVILSETTTEAGEYAFQGCESLSTVYTQTYDQTAADGLQETISNDNPSFAERGYVAPYDAPDSTVSTAEDGAATIETTQTENAVITVSNSSGSGASTTTVSAVVDTSDGWQELANALEQVRNSLDTGAATVEVQLSEGATLSGEVLGRIAEQNVKLQVTDEGGSVWTMELSGRENISGNYELSASTAPADMEKVGIDSETGYRVQFSGDLNLNATLQLPLSDSLAYQTATLYQKNGGKVEPLQSVIVDAQGMAAYRLASVDSGTEYFIGINAASIPAEEAVVPETLYDAYGVSDSTLMDENGVSYVVTGRSSAWGVDLRTVMIGLGVLMLLAVLIVGLVMALLSRRRQTFAIPEEEPEDLDRNALEIELMKELLEEQEQR